MKSLPCSGIPSGFQESAFQLTKEILNLNLPTSMKKASLSALLQKSLSYIKELFMKKDALTESNGFATRQNPLTRENLSVILPAPFQSVYTGVDKNFRLCPGIQRDTEHWKNLYRHRVQIERTINLIKDTFSVNYRKSYRTVSAKSNVYLAVITQLIGVILADAIHQLKNFKSIRKLIAS